MMLGEGEVQLPDVCDTIIQGRREGLTKREILKRLCHIEGVYVPAFYDVSYRPDGRVEAITAKEGAPAVVRKAIIQDMNSQPLPENFVVPMIGAVARPRADRSAARLRAGLPFLSGGLHLSSHA